MEQFRKLTKGDARRGAPKGNTNHLVHGTYANRFLSDDERLVFDGLVERLRDDFVFNQSSDLIQIELAGIYYLKLGRALGQEDYDAAHKLDQMLRGHLKDLKSTKLSREGDTPAPAETTPAEWATALLERVAAAEKEAAEAEALERTKPR